MSDAPAKGTILLVDDDKFLLDMYSMKFSGAGYAVEAFLSAKQALEMLHGGLKPDVILFDLTMPEMDGFVFLKTIADEHLAPASIKVALTNQSDAAEQAKVAELGAERYIVKASMIPSEVVAAVGEELAKKKAA
jgi:CheY-like chemotaxis protein